VDLIQLYIVSLKEKTNLLIVVIVPRVFSVPIAEEIDFAQGGKMDQLGKTPINENKLEELLVGDETYGGIYEIIKRLITKRSCNSTFPNLFIIFFF
jgi:hypothetical protein